ncbi:hypothetical protein [Streptomyces noursei]|uniref:Uncharacterized protein n=1 Tax=Streptomyces noursei TaxID=1971 RepID=A0A059WGM9_STRNR|nr:hypothetical protein [Streptomyces noursei]AIA06997.1 hypothetical protein DC74_6563 [Streptomyces noursei]UWS75430.1 hypothetical protein N1H47_31890 [Streptomyces noursei]GCB94735.1 hypothetical protein SALB_07536 [Streptomyces noursei]
MENTSRNSHGLDASSAREALDSVAASRAQAAVHVASPWWYHVGMGVTVALLFLSMSLRMASWAVPLLVGVVVVLGLAVRRATGVSFDRYTATPGATRLFGIYALASLLAVVTGMYLEWGAGVHWAIAGAGLVVGVLTTVVGYRVDAVARHDIRAGR